MKRKLKMALSILLTSALAVACTLVPSLSASDEYDGPIRIAILDDASLVDENSASYDSASLKSLFEGAGYKASVINSETLACFDDFGTHNFDVLMIPTGEAFPSIAAVNFKRFLSDGGKLITSGGYAFKNTVFPKGSDVAGEGGTAISVTSTSKNDSQSFTHEFTSAELTPGAAYTLTFDAKYSNVSSTGGFAHASTYFYSSSGTLASWKDFMTVSEGDGDWRTVIYDFTMPQNAAKMNLIFGFYIAEGKLDIDNVVIRDADGGVVFSEDFENGTSNWRVNTGVSSSLSTTTGISRGGDNAISLSGDSTAKWELDASGEVLDVRLEAVHHSKNSSTGAFIVLEKGGNEVERIPVSTASEVVGRHRRHITVKLTEYDFEKAYFVLESKNGGKSYIDNIKIEVDGKTLLDNGGTTEGAVVDGLIFAEKTAFESAGLSTMEPNYIGDLLLYPDGAVPLFDIEAKYDDGVRIAAAEGQTVFEHGDVFTVAEGERISGYSAITVTGNYRGRWQPLLYAYDNIGQCVGTVGAVFRVFNNPSSLGNLGLLNTWEGYEGTSIGFFGVNSHDLFASGNEKLRSGLVKLVETLCEGAYIANVDNYYDCYRQGEEPRVIVSVENQTEKKMTCLVNVTIRSEDTGEIVFTANNDVSVVRNGRRVTNIKWKDAGEFKDDFYYVDVTLSDENGKVLDAFTTGFVVWDDEVIKNGPHYTYEDNYINITHSDGTKTSVFASGVDDGGNSFINEDQTPLAWKKDFERRVDTGVYIYENLQQSPAYGDFAFLFDNGAQWEKHLRTVDTVVYLSQKYDQIYMMGVAIGCNTADVKGTEKLCELSKEFAERYKDVGGIIYYLNGDLVCTPTNEIDAQFREFLKERYGTDEKLKEAWGKNVSLESVKYDTAYNFGGTGWADVKAYDHNLFRAWLVNRWTKSLKDAIDSVTNGERLVLCEFWSWAYSSIDTPHVMGELGYSNIGFFDDVKTFAQVLANSDQRWQGKSFGIGETNKRTHPGYNTAAGGYSSGTYEESRGFFFTTYYTTYAMGGNHYQIWCFNDESKYTFSWGMNTGGEHAPRDLFYWMRNANAVTKAVAPVYKTPKVAIVTPDSTRLGGSKSDYDNHYKAQNAFDIAQRMLVDGILTLNECNFDIPDGIEVIYYPMSYTMPDEVYEKLLDWVEGGGVLYISGDPSYDYYTRKRTNESRLETLAGVRAKSVKFNGTDVAGGDVTYTIGALTRNAPQNITLELCGATALYSDKSGAPVVTKNNVGDGIVIYSSAPIELNHTKDTLDADVALYKGVLELANVETAAIKPSDDNVIKYFKLDLADGGSFHEIVNAEEKHVRVDQTIGGDEYSFSVLKESAGFLRTNKDGGVTALMYNGKIEKNGSFYADNDCLAVVISLDGDAIERSKQVVVMPQSTGAFAYQSEAEWADLTVVLGQIYGGEFIVERALEFEHDDKGRIKFDVTESEKNKVIVIAERESANAVCESYLKLVAGEQARSVGPTDPTDPDPDPDTSNPNINNNNNMLWLWITIAVVAVAVVAVAAFFLLSRRSS